MNITPDQARELLDGATPGPWELRDTDALMNGRAFHLRQSGKPGIRVSATTYGHNDDPELIAAAPDLAQTIAGMEWEYGLRQPRPEPHAEGELYTSWGYRLFAAKAAFAGLTDRGVECYIVRRLVGPVEVTE